MPRRQSECDETVDTTADVFSSILDNQSRAEFVEAAAAEQEAHQDPGDEVESPEPHVTKPSESSEPGHSKRRKTKPPEPRHGGIGISDVAIVKRKGVICYHCSSEIQKGDVRFELVYKMNKPPRSIHTHCVNQLNETSCENSMNYLQRLVETSPPSNPDEMQACIDALGMLDTLKTILNT